MTDYLKPTFTVAQRGRDQAECEHGMVRPKDGSCCFCGAPRQQVEAETEARALRHVAP